MTQDEFIMKFMIAAAPEMMGEFHKGEKTIGQIVDDTYRMAFVSLNEIGKNHHQFYLCTTEEVLSEIMSSIGETPMHTVAESLEEIARSVHNIHKKM